MAEETELKHRANTILRNHIMTNNCDGCDMPNCVDIARQYAEHPKNCCKSKLKNKFTRMILDQIKFS